MFAPKEATGLYATAAGAASFQRKPTAGTRRFGRPIGILPPAKSATSSVRGASSVKESGQEKQDENPASSED